MLAAVDSETELMKLSLLASDYNWSVDFQSKLPTWKKK